MATAIRPKITSRDDFQNLGQFLAAVRAASSGQVDPRLRPYQSPASPQAAHLMAAAGADEMSGASDPFGGFAVPTSLLGGRALSAALERADPFGSRVTRIDMPAPITRIPARVDKNHTSSVSGGLTLKRRPETVAAASSRMELERVELAAHSLMGFTWLTDALSVDAGFEALLEAGFADELAGKLIQERIRGTGVGEFQGVLTSGALITVLKETGQTADTLKGANIQKMAARCWGYAKAIWLANHDALPQLLEASLAFGSSDRPVLETSKDPNAETPFLLLGRPLFLSEHASTLGDVGDLILVNPSEYLEGRLGAAESAVSPFVRWAEHEKAFKFWIRNAGAPWWSAVLTPANSSTTLSPFVVLEERA